MLAYGQRSPIGFNIPLTRLGKIMLMMYAGVYVLELIGEKWLGIPIFGWLALGTPGSGGFYPWQLITHPLIHDPGSPISFLLDCLVFYFFAGTVESALGTRGFLRLYVAAAVGAAIAGLLFNLLVGVGIPYAGMMPSLLALIVVFGLLQPETTVLLMFVLPIKAKYISYGTVIITALTFLARTNPYGAYHLGGIALAWLHFRSPTQWLDINWWQWKYFEFRQRRHRTKFTVIDGKKRGDNDRPTIH
ncbi:Rhomboid family protein [Desulfosarcina cetonica]|uniref:rhomboid family intramembrane serine protease n=1 Tax=Desulfosarcina cetonica TaxID=90730 RepID=UPI0006D0765C|nr:rhomboid family intramembrane serine protease [Desulfosarcina cetonica]VTR67824.1 Rhomboid family protein [Desulfosarcina cetonica]